MDPEHTSPKITTPSARMLENWIQYLLISCCCMGAFSQDSFEGSITVGSATSSSSSSTTITKHTTTAKETSTSGSETLLHGTRNGDYTTSTSRLNRTSTLTSAPASTVIVETLTTTLLPTNTQPCNLYVEFCTRPYSNITNVGTHNSPFVRRSNAAANQDLDVKNQLNDGIRMRKFPQNKIYV